MVVVGMLAGVGKLAGDGSGAGGGAVLGDAVRQSRPAPAAKRLISWKKNNGSAAAVQADILEKE